MAKRKMVIAGRSGNYIGRFKGFNTWHRILARSEEEAIGKMLKGTRFIYSQVIIKKYKSKR